MIELTKLNGKTFLVNPHLIETIEETPDTRINFFTGKSILVKENATQVVQKIIEYRKKLGYNSHEL